MSQGARIFLGVTILLLAAGFLALVPFMKAVSPQAGPGMAICGLFCGLVAVACFSKASHPLTIRLIGGVVFLVCAFYLGSEVLQFLSAKEGLAKTHDMSQPSLRNSLIFMLLVGLPSGYAALKGRYPTWGILAAAFGGKEKTTGH